VLRPPLILWRISPDCVGFADPPPDGVRESTQFTGLLALPTTTKLTPNLMELVCSTSLCR
jgi:hypothetical protein